MKYFSDDFQDVIDEIFNIESCGINFKNGILLDKTENIYPVIQTKNRKIILKSNYIILYLPKNNIYQLVEKLSNKLNEMSISYKNKYGEHHLNKLFSIESGNDNFTVLKAKNISMNLSTTTIIENGIQTGFIEGRKIFININDQDLSYIIGLARFTIIINNYTQLIDNIENRIKNSFPLSANLVSIIYDSDKLFNYENNHVYTTNITLKNFKIFKNLHEITYMGCIDKNKLNDINYKIPYIDKIHLDYFKYPEYLAGWFDKSSRIDFCSKKSYKFEIIRQLGKYNYVHGFGINLVLKFGKSNTDLIDFNLLNINNGRNYDGTIIKNDCCRCCNTPLYDEIYVEIKDNSGLCYAYCDICINIENLVGTIYSIEMYDTKIIPTFNKISRTIYPKSVHNIISDNIHNSDIKKILTGMTNFHFSIDHIKFTIDNDIYIGWYQDIKKLYTFLSLSEQAQNYKIIPINLINKN